MKWLSGLLTYVAIIIVGSMIMQAGELEQVNFNPPINTFEFVRTEELTYTYEWEQQVWLYPYGAGHTATTSYVFFSENGSGWLYYRDEQTNEAPQPLKTSDDLNLYSGGLIGSTNGKVFHIYYGKIYEFNEATKKFDFITEHAGNYNVIAGGYAIDSTDNGYDLINRKAVTSEDKGYAKAKTMYGGGSVRFAGWAGTALFQYQAIDARVNPQTALFEARSINQESFDDVDNYVKGYIDRDMGIHRRTKNFHISKDYLRWEDTGIKSPLVFYRYGTARTHSFLYVQRKDVSNTDRYYVDVYRLRNDELYGEQIYKERGRIWQHKALVEQAGQGLELQPATQPQPQRVIKYTHNFDNTPVQKDGMTYKGTHKIKFEVPKANRDALPLQE